MNPIVIMIIMAVVVMLIVSVIAHKLGFRLTKIKAKLGLVEAEMTRAPGKPVEGKTASPEAAPPIPFEQKAAGGGVIHKSTIKAPAGTTSSAHQIAEDEGSRIDDSHIELK